MYSPKNLSCGFAAVISLSALAMLAVAQGPAAAPLMVHQLKPNVYWIEGGGGNSGVIVGDKGVIVVDAKTTPAAGKELLEDIAKITPKPVTTVILTHSDGDHVNGLASFPAGITIIAHENNKKEQDAALAAGGRGAPPAGHLPTQIISKNKQDLKIEVIAEREVPQNSKVLRDQDIRITPYRKNLTLMLRLVTIWDEEKQEEITFLTNHLKFGATTIARIYKERWQIELFFKALKQLLRVKTFVGTSANALKTQIWIALIAILVLKYLHLKSQYGWSLSNLVALVRQQLFVYRNLYLWLDAPFEAPPVLTGVHDSQLALGF